jgi:DsbC/DsbD-like thiol-disulfide interchange protein
MIRALFLLTALAWIPIGLSARADERFVVAGGARVPSHEAAPETHLEQKQDGARPKPDGDQLVKVALLADHAAIRAGETCTLAVKLTIEPKWHIYWQNPGDAGVRTAVDVHAPKGFEVGRVRYPAPAREEAEGDLVSYVYTGEAALLFDVTAPKELPAGTRVEFDVDCSWLVCTTLCVRGAGKAHIELPAVATSAAATSDSARLANEKEFKEWRAKLPLPYEELLALEGFHASEFTDWKKPFTLEVPGARALDFYPYVDDPITLNVSTLQLQAVASGCTMKIQFEPPAGYEGPGFGFRGVVAARTAKGETYYEIEFGYGSPRMKSSTNSPGKSSGTSAPGANGATRAPKSNG